MNAPKTILLGEVQYKKNDDSFLLDISNSNKQINLPIIMKNMRFDVGDAVCLDALMKRTNSFHYFEVIEGYKIESMLKIGYAKIIGKLTALNKITIEDKEYDISLPLSFEFEEGETVHAIGSIECLGQFKKEYNPYIKIITVRKL